jgi:2-polyprenyl-3-methyl-5-hydroxy-6-metoxy-1,4-benzoquinol methylase
MQSKTYSDKPDLYFQHPRTDIVKLLPSFSTNVLEIGCGTGATLSWLKKTEKCATTYGVELHAESCKQAINNVDFLIEGNIESDDFNLSAQKFELVLFLDVLEHLVDPWTAIKKIIDENLAQGGVVVVSLPNIRFYAALLPLIFKGEFEYQKTGVLDGTHLRFFTKKSAIELVNSAGLTVKDILSNPIDFSKKQTVVNMLTLGMFRNFLTQQYLIQCKKD